MNRVAGLVTDSIITSVIVIDNLSVIVIDGSIVIVTVPLFLLVSLLVFNFIANVITSVL